MGKLEVIVFWGEYHHVVSALGILPETLNIVEQLPKGIIKMSRVFGTYELCYGIFRFLFIRLHFSLSPHEL